MPTEKSCRIELQQVDSNLARLSAFLFFISNLIFLSYLNIYVMLILAIDTMIKLFFGINSSIICKALEFVLNQFKIKKKMVDIWPKKFAMKVSLIFAFAVIIFYFFGMLNLAKIVSIIFLVASGLDTFFNLCLACMIYPYIRKYLK
jgi:hypothetical protein